MKKIGIVILNYNNWEDTTNCINSILRYNTYPIKIMVVDNGSTKEDCVGKLHSYFSEVFGGDYLRIEENQEVKTLPLLTFLVSKINDGYAKGNNKGLKYFIKDEGIDGIMILNNDILFVEDIIPRLVEKYDNIDNCGIISPVLYKKDFAGLDYNCARRAIMPRELIKKNFCYYIYNFLHKRINDTRYLLNDDILSDGAANLAIDLPSGSCMLIEKTLFAEIGLFDSNTFLYYEEDILYKKIKKINKQNYLDLESKCIHLGASSTSKSPSLFLIKTDIDSASYYIKNYSDSSWFTILFFNISKYFYLMSCIVQKKLNIKIHK